MEDQAVGPVGGVSPEVLALAKVVAGLRAEAEHLEAGSAMPGTRTPDEVAELARGALSDTGHVGAVVIYGRGAAGNLDLIGHAGLDGPSAERWSHVPPTDEGAALQALAEERPVWLEAPDAERRPLLAARPGQWPSRAWIPVLSEHPATTVIGFLRTHPGPFDAATRSVLRRTVQICGRSLGTRGAGPGEPARVDENATIAAIQPVLDVLPCPAVLLTPLRAADGTVADFRIDAAAAESVDVAGRRGEELVGRTVLDTYPTVAGSDLWHGYLDALTTGRLYEGDPFTYEETLAGVPRESVYSVRASRLGDRLVVSWIRHDTDEREARRLADLQRLGNLGWAGWKLGTGRTTWSDQVYDVFGRDPALGPVGLEELPSHGRLLPDDAPKLRAAVQRLLADGESIDQPFRITTPDGVRHLRIVAEAEPDAHGTPVEVHGFFQDLTAQRGAEIALQESERANLVQRGMLRAERALADRLRETLLPIPEQSLELAGLRVEIAYLPSDTVLSVGGDWYSAIQLPDGCALFVVGDVAGHGLPAVGTMAQLRFTAKGMAVTGSRLPAVLNRLNALLLHTATDADGATATMVMARYRPDDGRLSWVRAGHLPPLLIRGGEAQFLSQPEGCLLGASFDAAYAEAVIDLMPGDHLLLYTDGLVEDAGEDIEEGLTRFAAVALGLVRDGHAETLARTLAAARTRHDDDICVLDIHVPVEP
ncbi:SpoIIE family protein phosphatase [Streptomyces sp. NPDC090022]|uniref:SpoIIE family protein phosphatase n=1 Tax=Streptomyces sp. NPDC090022 TaxID=3365920 RepID=UPI0038282481